MPADASRDTKEHVARKEIGVTQIPACMMGCVWKSTMTWDTCATVRWVIVVRIVKILILVAQTLASTLVLVFIPMTGLSATVLSDSKGNTVKSVIFVNPILVNLVTNATRQESRVTNA